MYPPHLADPKEGRNHASLFFYHPLLTILLFGSLFSPSLEGRAGVGFVCLFVSFFLFSPSLEGRAGVGFLSFPFFFSLP